ncbi:hypothetical protein LDENG_00272350 [Lucifuga dentata]|nr:hypothetical protein LDENG_00272350 [Lucifuga dentata]
MDSEGSRTCLPGGPNRPSSFRLRTDRRGVMLLPYLTLLVLDGFVGGATAYSNGKVTIACGDMVPQHRGFLMEARDAGKSNSPAVGIFVLLDPAESQLLTCGHAQGSAVSHRRSSRKTDVQVVWESPGNPPDRVQFLVTAVWDYKNYWVKMAGPVVSLRGATAFPTTAAPAEPTSPAALSTAVSLPRSTQKI